MDAAERDLLAETLRKTMTASSGPALDTALADLGWPDLLAELPEVAVPSVFRLLGETGAHASVLNDVVLAEAGRPLGGTLPLPYTGRAHVVWERTDVPGIALDPALPLRTAAGADPVPLAAGRRALGWWLLGSGHAMLALARAHVLSRVQFGKPLASFQAVRHRLAETLVALEGAEAALIASTAHPDDLASLLAKAAAGEAALTAARHCQQVMGGIGFTAEHDLHHHIKRALVLDGLLGSTKDLSREAGALLRSERTAPRLIHL
ncbi:acyl-CoA dehydrogenase-like protein [Actinocorallia herbida]|uniref:Acyl-CoA dehydrogenase-like protein n=1 Tax=Actinocorallia herbida TaxID=58109 RepID=A0A3N1CUA4_9ACTN|nr:acyl-CoA dehydrogenase family protein [Actinocorallia herbida]ROO84891.1 acyl-CoA dehydrogenase-like protein [Actinocorallia herbida]